MRQIGLGILAVVVVTGVVACAPTLTEKDEDTPQMRAADVDPANMSPHQGTDTGQQGEPSSPPATARPVKTARRLNPSVPRNQAPALVSAKPETISAGTDSESSNERAARAYEAMERKLEAQNQRVKRAISSVCQGC